MKTLDETNYFSMGIEKYYIYENENWMKNTF